MLSYTVTVLTFTFAFAFLAHFTSNTDTDTIQKLQKLQKFATLTLRTHALSPLTSALTLRMSIKKTKKISEKCTFKPGDRVEVTVGDLANELGYVRFVGTVKGKETVFVGCELDEARGKHDGLVKAVQYFKTAEKHGYMAPFNKFQYFEENKISLNWSNTVSLIALHWFRTECKECNESELKDSELQLIIVEYGTLLRFQNVYAIGNNEYGEFGLSEMKERLKFTKLKIKDIERGYANDGNFYLVRGDEQNNHVLSAGNNNWCQLGLGKGNHRTIMKFSKIKKCKNVLFVSKGLNATHALFAMKNGNIYGCGNNTMNQLGLPCIHSQFLTFCASFSNSKILRNSKQWQCGARQAQAIDTEENPIFERQNLGYKDWFNAHIIFDSERQSVRHWRQ